MITQIIPPASELISHLQVNIIILAQLSELGPWLAASEDIRSERRPNTVGEIVFDLGIQQVVSVRRTEEGKEGESEGLVHEELCKPHGGELM